MQISEYLIQQSQEFNNRIDGIEELARQIADKLTALEYNIKRIEDKLDAVHIEPQEGFEYEQYIR